MKDAGTHDRSTLTGTCSKVEVDGLWLSVRDMGSGDPLLLVHGYGVSHLEFRRVLELLAATRRVIAPDLPGHGESDAPREYRYTYEAVSATVAGLLQAMGLNRVAILGHSMGGGVALHLAARHERLVERLVLSDSACYPTSLPFEGKLILMPGIGRLLFRYVYGVQDLLRYFRKRVYRDARSFDEALVRYYWSRIKARRDAAYAMLKTVASADGLGELPARVRCPTLIVWGEHDGIFPLQHGRRLAEEIEDARLEILSDCGHAPAEEQPERFVEAVAGFLS